MALPVDMKSLVIEGVLENVTTGPVNAVERVLDNGIEALDENNNWSRGFSQLDQTTTSQIMAVTLITPVHSTSVEVALRSLITTPPSLHNREALPEPQAGVDCNSQINQFKSQASQQNSQQLASATQQFAQQSSQLAQKASQSVSQAVAAQNSAQAAQSSAQVAQSSAEAAASAANSSLESIKTSASSAVLSASMSASGAISAAMASASSSISIASASASSAIASAVSSAEASASDARATATFAIAQAQATISLTNSQASASVRSSQVQAITATQAAIAIVLSIIGSSLLSILAYFLLTRYRTRRQRRQDEQDEMEQSDYKEPLTPLTPDLKPRSISYFEPASEFEFEPKRNKFWSFRSSRLEKAEDSKPLEVPAVIAEEPTQPRPSLGSGKRTLVYDADRPDQPPKFETGEELGDIEDEDEKRKSQTPEKKDLRASAVGKAV